ncbi:MAG: hypothetical protein AAGF97_17590, partial [Planctomycetota bacterium]
PVPNGHGACPQREEGLSPTGGGPVPNGPVSVLREDGVFVRSHTHFLGTGTLMGRGSLGGWVMPPDDQWLPF